MILHRRSVVFGFALGIINVIIVRGLVYGLRDHVLWGVVLALALILDFVIVPLRKQRRCDQHPHGCDERSGG